MEKRLIAVFMCLGYAVLNWTVPGIAQTDNWEETSAELHNAIDVHVHTLPENGPASVDTIELARIARRYGMRALLFKNHFTQTASLAYLINRIVPGIEAYGGIVLNNTAGGINPNAVEHMALTTGRYGRVVWMPTWDSEHYTRTLRPNPDFVPISQNGELLPEVKDVLTLMARYNLALATGHSSPEESLLLIREARLLGIDRIIVTNPLLPADTGLIKEDGGLPIETMVSFIRAVGTANAIMSTDLGQELNPLHTDGMISFILKLGQQGFTKAEIDEMCKINPARLLGLQ